MMLRTGLSTCMRVLLIGMLLVGLVTAADAESSPTLCHLAAPFDKATAAISSSTSQIKSGKVSSKDMESMDNDVNAVQRGTQDDGVPAPDQVPTDSQLASGGS
jgi:hypothetical protein